MGDVPGRGVEAAALKSDLRAAVQAYAVVEGRFPARVVDCLDRFVRTTGRGELTTLVYLTLDPETGDVRFCSAGHCAPLLLTGAGVGRFLHDNYTPPLGTAGAGRRQEERARLEAGATLLLFSDGLVENAKRPFDQGLLKLAEAAAAGPDSLDRLCDHVLERCLAGQRRDDDISLLGIRRSARG